MKKMLLLLVCLTTFAWLHAETATFICKDYYGDKTKNPATTWNLNDNLTFTYAKGSNNSTSPLYSKDGDVRVYAGNTVTLTATNDYKIQAIAFTLSSQGISRYSNVIANTGLVGAQAVGDSRCTWRGDATAVTFTVGDKSIYATDDKNKTKPGQLCYTSVTVTYSKVGDEKHVATPTFSQAAGNVIEGTAVTIACATEGATIYYTTDGTDPSASSTSTEYTAPIAIDKAMTIKAIAVKEGMSNSDIAEAAYKLIVATPAFDPAAGAVAKGTEVTITCKTEGAQIYYTTDGTEPTIGEKNLYTIGTPIAIESAMTIKAIAVKEGYANSEIAAARYSIIGEAAPAPQAFFDFTTPANFGMTGTEDVLGHKFNLEGVTVEFTQATGGNKPTFSSNGGYHVRVYKNATIVISVAEGQSIESVQIKGNTLSRIQYNDGGEAKAICKSGETTANWWSPTLTQRAAASNEVVFTIDNTGRADIKSINVNDPVVTGVEDVTVDENAPVEYYNLQGVRVDNPENGIYIRRQGSKVSKVLVR